MNSPTVVNRYRRGFALVVARGADILLATWVWRDYDLTISSLCGLERRKVRAAWKWWAVVIGGMLEWIQPGHCEAALAADRARAQLAIDIIDGKLAP